MLQRVLAAVISLSVGHALLSAGPLSKTGCMRLRDWYSTRALREARAQLAIDYAESHARRAALAYGLLRGDVRIDDALKSIPRPARAHERGDSKVNHLVAYIIAHCLGR